MSAARFMVGCLLVISFQIVGCGRGARGGLGFPRGGEPLPTLRLVPEESPRGEVPYPRGTKIDKHAGVIYFPPGGGETAIWLRLEISGWGRKGLRGYDVAVSRNAICPFPPCGCEPSPFTPPCQSGDDCVEGSGCDNGNCEEAFIDVDRRDYVFEHLAVQPSVQAAQDSYHYHARIDPMERPLRDRGRRMYAGSLVKFTFDWCPMMDQGEVRIDPSAVPKIILGDGSAVKPLLGNVLIIQQQAQ